jgi:hypothetical protein
LPDPAACGAPINAKGPDAATLAPKKSLATPSPAESAVPPASVLAVRVNVYARPRFVLRPGAPTAAELEVKATEYPKWSWAKPPPGFNTADFDQTEPLRT